MGLAGAGDLVATCTSSTRATARSALSWRAAVRLTSTASARTWWWRARWRAKRWQTLSEAYGVELPITEVVRGVVWEGADPNAAARDLFARPLTTEFYGL